jgi:hypothetical protein
MNKRLRGIPPLEQPTIYRIIGEHRTDPARLLLLGSDGHHYVLNLHDGHAKTSLIEIREDEWDIELSEIKESAEIRRSA